MLLYLPFVSALITYYVFNSKGIDYRAVALGSLLPISIDLIIGEVSFGHSFLFPVSVLLLVMVGTINQSRLLRRRLLCIVIGVFLALVLEGTFIDESTWWWPLDFSDQTDDFSSFPSISFWIIRDVIGLIALYILISIGELHIKKNREVFFKTGRITS